MKRYVVSWLPASSPLHTIALVAGLVLVGTAFRVLFMLINAVLVAWVSQSIGRDVRSRIFSKALELDTGNFEAHSVSGVQAHIIHTTDLLTHGITNFYSGAITEPLKILACIIGAAFFSWQLTLLTLFCVPIAAMMFWVLNRRVRGLASGFLDRSLGFHHVVLDVLGAHRSVQANNMESFENQRFQKSTHDMRKVAVLIRFYEALANPLTELLGVGMLSVGMITSAYLIINKETALFGIPVSSTPLSVTSVTLFLGMLIGATDPLRKMSRVISGINNGMAAAKMLHPFLELESSLAEPADPRPLNGGIKSIELRDVRFAYDGVNYILNGSSLKITARERVAIVGINGSGKSTLVGLACRFFDPQTGDILINGCSIRCFKKVDIRSRFAVVPQRAELFNESVMHNIRYGRWDATDEEVFAAARLARAHEFIAATPDGYETVVGSNGHRLSGGQRQRIALARAFLRDADVLILDEATSQVDIESEQLIHDALQDYGSDRIIIFITHRESALAFATRAVRMEAGVAIEIDQNPQAAA
jgi:ATP-binding cassette subfamily B protein/subfamily B ATP-binding cassette protein MsbA